MKAPNKLLNLLLASTVIFILSACDTKTTEEETNTTSLSNPTTQTTDDVVAGGEVASTGGTTTPNGASSTDTANTSDASNDSSTGDSDDSTTSGTDDNVSTGANDDNTSTTPTITLNSLTLTIDKTSLNKDDTTPIKVMATYSDNTSKELTDNVEWIVTPSDAIQVSNATLTALKDKATSIQAKVGTILSNQVNLNIIWVVNGHTLPPEPDKTLNDSTLLGIDVNDNGVRDDVERWIYEEYKDKHPIHVDIAMQAARGYKLVLESPERAKEIRLKVNGALFCGWYYQKDAHRYNDPTLVHERIDTPVKSKYFNTKDRNDVYWQYDRLLSGGVYDLPWSDEMKALCDFNTSKYGK